ncbi:TonB-dependent receptor [Chondrinema litorale]|uniref:TonB-dependent receptor n=1 Tax=Chondrinema litorale TaxID=2994555 RepID=UPI002543ECE0|nr:TonB-dependent receptor [Chondrinema litorale]UZR97242.1 TonB-dependent receptor [Chondrinema litorale]
MSKHYTKHYLIIFLSIITTNLLFAQQNEQPLLTVNLSNAHFEELVNSIESQSNYRFYFDTLNTDTLLVNVQMQNKTINIILDEVLKGDEFNYSVDKENHVFVTHGRKIQPELPYNFFSREKNNVEKTEEEAEESIVVDYFQNNQVIGASQESKLYEIGIKSNVIKKGNATISGRVIDQRTGEPIVGAAVYIEEPLIGVSADQLGYYSLSIPKGKHKLKINSLGMRSTERNIIMYSDGTLDIEMQESVQSLKEVVVEAELEQNVINPQMGIEKMDIKTIKQIPTAMGESDVLRVVLTLPGVSSVGEASTGFNVRGGAVDQNLILLNDATIYNPSHLFGFFSAFNPDMLKDVQLYKSSIPAKYGGRLSSVLDITGREGNKKKFSGSGGLGLITSRLTLEGPIGSEKTSFIVSGRSNYSNWLLKELDDPDFRKSKASFYDINFGISHEFNEKNSLFVNGYYSTDQFQFRNDTTYKYKNQALTAKWKTIVNDKLYGELSASYSKYDFSVEADLNPVNAYKLDFSIEESKVKAGMSFFPNAEHGLEFGVSSKMYKLKPGSFQPNSSESLVSPDELESEKALESAIYLSDDFSLSPKISINAGLRYVMYNYMGPKTVYNYVSGVPKTENSVLDTINYSNNEFIKTYSGPEVRAAIRYSFTQQASVKLSYNMQRQFIHMLSNSTSISPTDIWKLSDTHIKPQYGQQLSLGLYKNFQYGIIETSIEGYVKKVDHYLDYKSGASLIMNHNIETDVINTEARSYGVEVMLKKTRGKLNGWVSYTYSRSLLKQKDPIAGELINEGDWYPSNFDKPHDFTMVGNYKFTHRYSLSLNFTYSTGRPITLPVGSFYYGGSERVYYSNRNEYRIPDYYRADVAFNIEGNHKIRKLAHSSWTLAIYNLTGRKNPYSIFFTAEDGEINGYKLSIFGRPIPTITYNFKF